MPRNPWTARSARCIAAHRFTRQRGLLLATVLICLAPTSSAAQQDAEEPLKSIFIPIPILFYTPETKFGFGGALSYIYRPPGSTLADRPSNFNTTIVFTTRSQVLAALGGDHYWDGERQHGAAGLQYRKFPNTFYGLGNDTPNEGEDYTDEGVGASVDYLFRIRPALRVGGGILYGSSSITETKAGGLLAGTSVPGSHGGHAFGGGLRLNVDNRNSTTYPTRGGFYDIAWRVHGAMLGAEFEFNSIVLDLRHYISLGGRNLLALRAIGNSSGGHVPFQLMPTLGGETVMRGYIGGRFRDRKAAAAQAEVRLGTWHRLGMTLFASAGQVGTDEKDLALDRLHTAYGFGIRTLLIRQENLNLRFDWGFGEDQSGFYFGVGEAF